MEIFQIKLIYFIFLLTYILGANEKNKQIQINSIKDISTILNNRKYKGEVEFMNNSNIYFYELLNNTNFQIDFREYKQDLEIYFTIFKEHFYHNDYYKLYITIPKNINTSFEKESGNYLTNFIIFNKNENKIKIGKIKITHNNLLFWKRFPLYYNLTTFYFNFSLNQTIEGNLNFGNISLTFKGNKTKYSQNILFCLYSNLYMSVLFITCIIQVYFFKSIDKAHFGNKLYGNISMILILYNILLTYNIGLFIFYIFITTQNNTGYATIIFLLILLELLEAMLGESYYRGDLLNFFSPLFVFGLISMIDFFFYWWFIYYCYKMINRMIVHSLGYRKLEVSLIRNNVSVNEQTEQLNNYASKKVKEISNFFIPLMFISSFISVITIFYPIIMCILYSLFFIPQIIHRLKVNKVIKKKGILLFFSFYFILYSDKFITVCFFLYGKYPLNSKPQFTYLKIFLILFFLQIILLFIIDLYDIGFDSQFLKKPEFKFFENFNETLKALPNNRRESVSKEECCICLEELNKDQEEIQYDLKEGNILEMEITNENNNIEKNINSNNEIIKNIESEKKIENNDFHYKESFINKFYKCMVKIKLFIKKIFIIKKSIEEKTKNKKFVITPCNHVYHSKCLKNWIEAKSTCPLCHSQLPEI